MKSDPIIYVGLVVIGLLLGIVIDAKLLTDKAPVATVQQVSVPQEPTQAGTTTAKADPSERTVPEKSTPVADQPATPQLFPQEVSATGTPVAYVVEPVFNFGKEERGNKVHHTFILENRGDAPLVVEKILSACGCTVPQLKDKTIEPGAKTEVAVTLNLHLQEGAQNRELTVLSNDPKHPRLILALKGIGTSRIELDPKTLVLKPNPETGRAEGTMTVRSADTLPILVTNTRKSHESLKVSVMELKPKHEFVVNVSDDIQGLTAPKRGWVHLITDQGVEYNVVGIPVIIQPVTTSSDAHNHSAPTTMSQK